MKLKVFNYPLLKLFNISKKTFLSLFISTFKNDLEINVIFVKKEYIQELNLKYRCIDKVTDVLAFGPYDNTGEVYICLDSIDPSLKEVLKIVAHGILHLEGYDHSEEMYNLQQKYLDKFYDILEDK